MRYVVSAAMVLVCLGCGGGTLEDDRRVGFPDGVSGIDVPAYGDDVPLADVPAADREEPVDGTASVDPGAVTDPGNPTDPGVGQDPGLGNDPGTAFDPGAPFDPGTIPDYGDAVGGCDPCGYGTIAGMTCAPNSEDERTRNAGSGPDLSEQSAMSAGEVLTRSGGWSAREFTPGFGPSGHVTA
jgi:hypothetical protein